VNGGIVPTPRRRAVVALRLDARDEISRGVAAGRSLRQIARGRNQRPRKTLGFESPANRLNSVLH